MEYELAKKLKDAGFPQAGNGDMRTLLAHDNITAKEESVYIPTLSELIEACVEISEAGDFHLETMDGRWVASTCWKHKKDEWEIGDTPETAVANLWLALNQE